MFLDYTVTQKHFQTMKGDKVLIKSSPPHLLLITFAYNLPATFLPLSSIISTACPGDFSGSSCVKVVVYTWHPHTHVHTHTGHSQEQKLAQNIDSIQQKRKCFSFFLYFFKQQQQQKTSVQAPFLEACCHSGLLSQLAPDFLVYAASTTPTNALMEATWTAATCPHFIKKHGSIAIMELEAEPRRNLKRPSPRHMLVG